MRKERTGEMPREKKKSLSLLMRLFLAIMIVVSIVTFISSIMYYNERLPIKAEKEQQIESLKEEKEELKELVDSERDEAYVVRMARRIWGLLFPDEEVFVNNSGS